jgi:hypothetical protein
MSQQRGQGDGQEAPESGTIAAEEGQASDHQESDLEAEQESAAAMDADVPQPPDADHTTEGQPS